jgi:pimeloyl-ACP methyl ester carboxylesterase
MPLVALAHGRPDPAANPLEQLWRQLQQELAQLVPGGRLVIATESGPDIHVEQPELVLGLLARLEPVHPMRSCGWQ